jgi:hypothetical protein
MPDIKKKPAAAGKKHKMRVLVGVRTFNEAEFFLTRGADEVYCGLPEIPNHGVKAENYASEAELLATIDLAKRLGKKVFIVANDVFPAAVFQKAAAKVASLVKYGASGVIIRDMALLEYFKKRGLKTYFTLSTLGLCFNREALRFFKERGVSRIVLPQHISPAEAAPMFDKKLGMDIEVFCLPLFYEVNINSLCSLSCPCSQEAVTDPRLQRAYTCLASLKRSDGGFYTMPMPDSATLLNYFYDFYHLGAGCMKVARGPNGEEVIELFYKSLLLTRLLEKGVSREAFVHEGKKIVSSSQNYGKRYIVKRF